MDISEGSVTVQLRQGVAAIVFEHPKANSLPLNVLSRLANAIEEAGKDPQVRVIYLRSAGEKTFCAGASFEEFQRIDSLPAAEEFFMGFARVILAIKNAPKFVVVEVQGKAVGGGVGIAAAADYNLAVSTASVRLSEFDLGIGPFTIGPAVERRIGPARFAALSIDTAWRNARWALKAGLFDQVAGTAQELGEASEKLLQKLVESSVDATEALKAAFWEGTEHWEVLLGERARISAKLLLGLPQAD